MQKRLIWLTKKLITFKTITGNKKEIYKSFTFLKKYLQDLSIKEISNNGFSSLLISNYQIKQSFAYDVILHGHIDVVPATDNLQFIPVVKGNKLFGRGALDMKGGLACMIELLKQSKKINKKILLMITSDEEIGGTNGTEYLLKNLGYTGKFFITGEGEKDWLLKYKQKGVLMINLKVKGKGEHSAYTWIGENAIKKLFSIYLEIEKLFPEDKTNKDHWYSTINLGKISGGLAVNSIPETAEAEIDIRFCSPWKTYKEILKKIQDIVLKYKGAKISIKYATDPMNTSLNNPHLQKLNELLKKTLNSKKDFYFKNHGTNDARFASQVNIPAVGFGPIGKNYHAKNEFVYIKSLSTYYKILNQFIISFS